MGSPQDPRARHREKARRTKKNAAYDAKKAVEANSAPETKSSAAVATSSHK